jgi:hypothetical protein
MTDQPDEETEEMFGAGSKKSQVQIPKGRSLPNGTVSFKSGSKPGPKGSGAARNARLKGK